MLKGPGIRGSISVTAGGGRMLPGPEMVVWPRIGPRMGNFGRVVRLSLKYRFTFIASILSALVVGVLWGGNLSALYPLVVICGRNQPLQEWCAEQITASQQKIAECEAFIAEAERESETAAIDGQAELQAQIARKETDKNAEQGALARYRRIQPYLEAYVPRQPFPTLLMVVALLLAGTLIKSVFLIAHTVLVARLSYLGGFQLQKRFFARTLRMDIATFNNDGTSDLMSRFTHDMQNLTGGLSVLFGKLVREPMKMIVCFVGAGIVCWRLLLLTLLVAPAAVLLIRGLARSLKRANRRAMEEMSQLYGTLGETLQGIKIVKAFTMERHERQRFHRTAKQYFRRAMKIARYDGLSRSTIEVMGMLMIFLGMMAGAYLVLQHQTHLLGIRLAMRPMNLESLLVFFGLLSGAADPRGSCPTSSRNSRPAPRPPTGSMRCWIVNRASATRSRRWRFPGTPRTSSSTASGSATSRAIPCSTTSTCGSASARPWPSWDPAVAGRPRWQT